MIFTPFVPWRYQFQLPLICILCQLNNHLPQMRTIYFSAMELADCICWYTIDLYVPIMSNLINISPRLKAYCILRSSALRDHRCKSPTVSFCFWHHGVQLIWYVLYPGAEFERARSKPMAANQGNKRQNTIQWNDVVKKVSLPTYQCFLSVRLICW